MLLLVAAIAAEWWPRPGRYQLQRNDGGVLFLVDTARGHCWTRTSSGGTWRLVK